ncbi:MAG: toll/interleukin-1 receptor domain-containing protein [Acidobacteriia bacterium]|nr:toll/interleukin-1 receptor domain-containing protein [Terriglobia bacterium]
MADIECDLLIQAEGEDGKFECHAFSGIPAARRSWIALVSSGSSAGRKRVGELRKELEALLLGSSPTAARTTVPCPAAPEEMNPADYPKRRKVLALVGTEDRPLKALGWYDRWQSDGDDSAVMTVLPPVPFDRVIDPSVASEPPHLLRRVNATFYREKIAETLPALLARAEVTTAQARVFISYRRVESLPLALQLFDALTHEGFEVFLDRFSIPPGYDFQRRLDQELADKSMVLLLESKHIRVSKWTQHEIDFAKRNRLGLLAVTMPGIPEEDRLASISFDGRLVLGEEEFKGEPVPVADPDRGGAMSDQWPELRDAARVVAQLKETHAAALFRRRHRLRADLVAELRDQKADVDYADAGPLTVRTSTGDHLLWLATRPADTADFRYLHTAHTARTPAEGSRAVIVAPQAALEPDRQELLRWLSKVSACLAFDEGDLPGVARRIAKGEWK